MSQLVLRERETDRQPLHLSFLLSPCIPFPSLPFTSYAQTLPSCHGDLIHAACFLMLQSTPKPPLLLRFDCHHCTKPGGCHPRGALLNKGIQPKDFEVLPSTSSPGEEHTSSLLLPRLSAGKLRRSTTSSCSSVCCDVSASQMV